MSETQRSYENFFKANKANTSNKVKNANKSSKSKKAKIVSRMAFGIPQSGCIRLSLVSDLVNVDCF